MDRERLICKRWFPPIAIPTHVCRWSGSVAWRKQMISRSDQILGLKERKFVQFAGASPSNEQIYAIYNLHPWMNYRWQIVAVIFCWFAEHLFCKLWFQWFGGIWLDQEHKFDRILKLKKFTILELRNYNIRKVVLDLKSEHKLRLISIIKCKPKLKYHDCGFFCIC